MAFYEKGSEVLELKKTEHFTWTRACIERFTRTTRRHPQCSGRNSRVQRSESDLLERGRKGETFPSIDSDGVSGQWREDEGAIILATGSGMSLRLVRKGERELVAEGGYRARWLRWENWEEDWNRLQRSRAKVGIRRPEDNIAPSKSTAESNIAGPSTFRPRNGKADPDTMPSSPASSTRNELVQVPGVRSVPRFIEPPLECACPCWSPDGKYVMFIVRPTEQAGGVVQAVGLWLREMSGSSPADGSKRWLVSNFFFGGASTTRWSSADPLNSMWSPCRGRQTGRR